MQSFLKRYCPIRYRQLRSLIAALFLCPLFFFGFFLFGFLGKIAPHSPNQLITSGQSLGTQTLSRPILNHPFLNHPFFRPKAAIAQPIPIRRINPTALSEQVYQRLPELPQENQYISSETGEPAITNTLVSRLIRYHVYIKNRSTVFRLDWKLTLADYLGAFERISASNYANYGLQENPYQNDIAAINALSIEQRNQLVNALYEVFTMPEPNVENSSNPDNSINPDNPSNPDNLSNPDNPSNSDNPSNPEAPQ